MCSSDLVVPTQLLGEGIFFQRVTCFSWNKGKFPKTFQERVCRLFILCCGRLHTVYQLLVPRCYWVKWKKCRQHMIIWTVSRNDVALEPGEISEQTRIVRSLDYHTHVRYGCRTINPTKTKLAIIMIPTNSGGNEKSPKHTHAYTHQSLIHHTRVINSDEKNAHTFPAHG